MLFYKQVSLNIKHKINHNYSLSLYMVYTVSRTAILIGSAKSAVLGFARGLDLPGLRKIGFFSLRILILETVLTLIFSAPATLCNNLK